MKYRLTENVIEYEGRRLFQIQAVKNFQADQWYIQAGELGGYVESERNLSQQGSCWLGYKRAMRLVEYFRNAN